MQAFGVINTGKKLVTRNLIILTTKQLIYFEEKSLLFSPKVLTPPKIIFKNMQEGNVLCKFNCNQVETKTHIFENCELVLSIFILTQPKQLHNIY